MVTAKLRCNSITDRGSCREVELNPISDANGSNKSWSQATPSGSVKLTINNPAAFEYFKVGDYYLTTFERTEL